MKEKVILGVGADIESIDRFSKLDRTSPLLKRVFTAVELDYCFSKRAAAPHLAARFAGKEAVVKAITCAGHRHPRYKDIQITNDEAAVPRVTIDRKELENLEVLISLSHCRDKALAFAIVQAIG